MKCIKMKCEHCIEKLHVEKIYTCDIIQTAFYKDGDPECEIDQEIKRIEAKLKTLQGIRKHVAENQQEIF